MIKVDAEVLAQRMQGGTIALVGRRARVGGPLVDLWARGG